jgi:hypothetical protein
MILTHLDPWRMVFLVGGPAQALGAHGIRTNFTASRCIEESL